MTRDDTEQAAQGGPVDEQGWPVTLGFAIGVHAQVEASDPEGLLTGTVPRMAATEDQIAAAERDLGERLPSAYREFLAYADGWPGVYFTLDLFGTTELQGGAKAPHARVLLETYEAEEVLQESDLAAADILPIATSQGNDLVMIIRDGRPDAGTVVWIDGEEYGRYPDFTAFFGEVVAMLQQYVADQTPA